GPSARRLVPIAACSSFLLAARSSALRGSAELKLRLEARSTQQRRRRCERSELRGVNAYHSQPMHGKNRQAQGPELVQQAMQGGLIDDGSLEPGDAASFEGNRHSLQPLRPVGIQKPFHSDRIPVAGRGRPSRLRRLPIVVRTHPLPPSIVTFCLS